jgi:hypothetical protein
MEAFTAAARSILPFGLLIDPIQCRLSQVRSQFGVRDDFSAQPYVLTKSNVPSMTRLTACIPWLCLFFAILALLAIPFGPVFYSTLGEFSELVQVYGGIGFGIAAAVLGIVGVATYRVRSIALTVISGLSSVVGFLVVAFIAVAYAMEWLSPAFY